MYRIASTKIGTLQERIEKMNRRAARLNCPAIALEIVSTEAITLENGAVEVWYNVEISGDRPMLNGWKFLAALTHVDEVGMVIRAIPGEVIPEKYRNANHMCEHCNVNRFRKETFVIQNLETGETKQVGRTCLQDFTGYGASPNGVASFYEMLGDLSEECENLAGAGYGHSANFIHAESYLGFVVEVIAQFGWVSKKDAWENPGKTATAIRAMREMFPISPQYEPIEVSNNSKLVARNALNWAEENLHGKDDLNDYLHNLKVVTSASYVEPKLCGILASLIVAYRKATQKPGIYVGVVGQKYQWTLKVESSSYMQTQFGDTWLVKLTDGEGNLFVWWAKEDMAKRIGNSIQVNAKIKEHKDFNGTKQNVISYVKVSV